MANIQLPTYKRAMNPPYIYGFPMNSIMLMLIPVVTSFIFLIVLTMATNSGLKIIIAIVVILISNGYLFFWLKKMGKRIIIKYYLKLLQPVNFFSNDKPKIKKVNI